MTISVTIRNPDPKNFDVIVQPFNTEDGKKGIPSRMTGGSPETFYIYKGWSLTIHEVSKGEAAPE